MDYKSISVVCPAYNSGKFILQTLSSAVKQTILPDEIIIVDDGSSDNTIPIVLDFIEKNKKIPISLIRQQHLGPGAARNQGIKMAKSEWVAFLDSDDIWYYTKIEVIKKHISENSNFLCHNEYLSQNDNKLIPVNYSEGYCETKPLSRQLFKRNYFSTSAVVIRKSVLHNFGVFNETLSSAQDYELWLRLSPHLKLIFVNEILGEYRIRKGNISTSKFWKRLVNLINVKFIHRKKVGFFYFVYILFLDIIYHLMTPFILFIKKNKV